MPPEFDRYTVAQLYPLETPAPPEHINRADPGNHAAPAPSAGSAPDLRRDLAAAIEVRDAADARARAASELADRAEAVHQDAVQIVERMKERLDDTQRVATEQHATAILEAFKRGEDLPQAPELPEVDSAALTAARARMAALHIASFSLSTEYDGLAAEAARAAAAVRALVDEIVFGEVHQLAAEAVAAAELHWQLMDKLIGLVMVDEARPEGPRLRAFQDELMPRLDRRRAAIASDPQLIEQHKYAAFLNAMAGEQKRAWLDYGRRLMTDASATFSPMEPTQ
jgi:hypothetical protein